MDTTAVVGIDVSKDRLDVHIRPSGEAFAVPRNGDGLSILVERIGELNVKAVALEAMDGFETVAAAGRPVVVVNPAQVRALPRR